MTFLNRDENLDLKLEIAIQGTDEKLVTRLPFVKSKNKHLYLAMDVCGEINVFGKKPLYVGSEENAGWDNSSRMDEEGEIKIFDYALVGYYTGDAKIKHSKAYKFENPFLVKACELKDKLFFDGIVSIEFKVYE